MTASHIPANDDDRARAAARSHVMADSILDALRAIAAEAAEQADAPVALVTFVGADAVWIKAAVGMEEGEVSRYAAFCAWAIHSLEVLWVEDALLDIRYSDNPLVLTAPFIRHYAGAPIVTPEGFALGAVCVVDYRPRTASAATCTMLERLAAQVADLLAPGSAAAGGG